RRALRFLETFQLFQRGQQGPGLQPVAVAGIRDQAKNAVAAAERGLEGEDRLDRIAAGARYPSRGGAIRVDPEVFRLRAWCKRFQLAEDGVCAIPRLQGPAEGEYVAPVALRMEQWRQRGG